MITENKNYTRVWDAIDDQVRMPIYEAMIENIHQYPRRTLINQTKTAVYLVIRQQVAFQLNEYYSTTI